MKEIVQVATLMKSITNEYEKQLNHKLSMIGLTASQCAVLNFLYETNKEFVNQRDIEKSLNLRNPTVTGLLKRLDEKGYVLVVPNQQDRRKKNVYLTEKAYDIQKKLDNEKKKLNKVLLRNLSKREVDSISRCLAKMLDNIED